MEYPLKIELNITQDDFIEVEILENALDMELHKKEIKRAFIIESIVMAVIAGFVLNRAMKGIIVIQTMFFVVGFWLLFAFHFAYNYFRGIKREFNMTVQHLLTSKDSNQFFTPERGMAYFYEDRCEYLTDEQRRYFSYDMIKHIKIIRHLYIFVMKRSREKNMRGFAYMVIPKRNLYEDEQQMLDKICRDIVKKYDLKEWTDSKILG